MNIANLIAALQARVAALEAKARAAAEKGIVVAEADITRAHDVLEAELAKIEAKLEGTA